MSLEEQQCDRLAVFLSVPNYLAFIIFTRLYAVGMSCRVLCSEYHAAHGSETCLI
jgi:hypothetical protein